MFGSWRPLIKTIPDQNFFSGQVWWRRWDGCDGKDPRLCLWMLETLTCESRVFRTTWCRYTASSWRPLLTVFGHEASSRLFVGKPSFLVGTPPNPITQAEQRFAWRGTVVGFEVDVRNKWRDWVSGGKMQWTIIWSAVSSACPTVTRLSWAICPTCRLLWAWHCPQTRSILRLNPQIVNVVRADGESSGYIYV